MDEKWFSNRDYIDRPHWTRKAIRTIQAVLNSTHGKIGRGRTFFFKAFGQTEEKFLEIIRMPEAFIIKRWDAELNGLTNQWHNAYSALSDEDRSFVDEIIDQNAFTRSVWKNKPSSIQQVMDFYLMERENIPLVDEEIKKRAIDAFEKSRTQNISRECHQLLYGN